ncbi:hypothetical protein ACHAXM_010657 [Skeletonema potamos]
MHCDHPSLMHHIVLMTFPVPTPPILTHHIPERRVDEFVMEETQCVIIQINLGIILLLRIVYLGLQIFW